MQHGFFGDVVLDGLLVLPRRTVEKPLVVLRHVLLQLLAETCAKKFEQGLCAFGLLEIPFSQKFEAKLPLWTSLREVLKQAWPHRRALVRRGGVQVDEDIFFITLEGATVAVPMGYVLLHRLRYHASDGVVGVVDEDLWKERDTTTGEVVDDERNACSVVASNS